MMTKKKLDLSKYIRAEKEKMLKQALAGSAFKKLKRESKMIESYSDGFLDMVLRWELQDENN